MSVHFFKSYYVFEVLRFAAQKKIHVFSHSLSFAKFLKHFCIIFCMLPNFIKENFVVF